VIFGFTSIQEEENTLIQPLAAETPENPNKDNLEEKEDQLEEDYAKARKERFKMMVRAVFGKILLIIIGINIKVLSMVKIKNRIYVDYVFIVEELNQW
jgi:hypothetical protein